MNIIKLINKMRKLFAGLNKIQREILLAGVGETGERANA